MEEYEERKVGKWREATRGRWNDMEMGRIGNEA